MRGQAEVPWGGGGFSADFCPRVHQKHWEQEMIIDLEEEVSRVK